MFKLGQQDGTFDLYELDDRLDLGEFYTRVWTSSKTLLSWAYSAKMRAGLCVAAVSLLISALAPVIVAEDETNDAQDLNQEAEAAGGTLRAQRLIGNIVTSTTTVLSVSTVMTTVPVSCLVNTLPATSCRRRRRRRKADDLQRHETELVPPSENINQLESSMKTSSAVSQVNPAARIFLYATRYITINSVVTSYTTITDESTTVSLSLLCTVAGQFLNARRCWLTIMPA